MVLTSSRVAQTMKYFFVLHGPGHSNTETLQYRHHKSQEYCAWHGHTAVVGAGALVDAGTKSSKFMGSAAPLELSSGAAGRAKLTTVAAFVSGDASMCRAWPLRTPQCHICQVASAINTAQKSSHTCTMARSAP